MARKIVHARSLWNITKNKSRIVSRYVGDLECPVVDDKSFRDSFVAVKRSALELGLSPNHSLELVGYKGFDSRNKRHIHPRLYDRDFAIKGAKKILEGDFS